MIDFHCGIRRVAAIAALAATACGPNEHDRDEPVVVQPAAEQADAMDNGSDAPPEPRVASPAEWETLRAHVQAQLDTVDQRLRRVRNLTIPERIALRRDVNERHIERARQVGVRVTGPVEPLVASGQLVQLADTTAHWIVRELDYSIPYVTPDAEAM